MHGADRLPHLALTIEYMVSIVKARHAWVQKYEIRIRKQNVLHKTFMVIGYLTSSLYSKL